jgi:hypothetical protein
MTALAETAVQRAAGAHGRALARVHGVPTSGEGVPQDLPAYAAQRHRELVGEVLRVGVGVEASEQRIDCRLDAFARPGRGSEPAQVRGLGRVVGMRAQFGRQCTLDVARKRQRCGAAGFDGFVRVGDQDGRGSRRASLGRRTARAAR